MSPWASPIVIIPKKTAPGKPPRRWMCVDYHMLNQLLPKVDKVHSKVKGVLTLVPLPKIDEIYAKLEGSTIYSTFDMRSGYYHLELSQEKPAQVCLCGRRTKGRQVGIQKMSLWANTGPSLFSNVSQQSLGRFRLYLRLS